MSQACPQSGKVRYSSPQEAHRALAHLLRRKGARSYGSQKAATAYQCPSCRAWHITSGGHRR